MRLQKFDGARVFQLALEGRMTSNYENKKITENKHL